MNRAPGIVDAFSAYDSGLPQMIQPSLKHLAPYLQAQTSTYALCPHPLYTRICSPLSLSSPLLSDPFLRPWHTPICHTSVFRIRQRHRGTVNNDLTSFGNHGRWSCFIFSTSLDSWSHYQFTCTVSLWQIDPVKHDWNLEYMYYMP